MQRFIGMIFLLLAGIAIGYGVSFLDLIQLQIFETPSKLDSSERDILYWVAPMDPNFRRDEPGKSPMGMELVPFYRTEAKQASDVGVLIDPSVVNNIGVQTVKAKQQSLRQKINTVGRLQYNDEHLSHVHLRASGWIHRLAIRAAGERVEHGALLFDVYSPELVKAQAEYLQIMRSGRKELIVPTRERLRALGISNSQIKALEKSNTVSQYVHVYAPRGGVVTKLNVADGKFVGPDSDIIVIADLDRLWLISDVFESQADLLVPGLAVSAKTAFANAGVIQTEIEYIYPELDEKTRTIRVRSAVENSDKRLKPGMFMTVSIESQARPASIVVPTTALIRTGFEQRVILADGNGRFRPAAVTSGIEADGLVEILSGLEEGEEVVVSGQFLIDSESSFAGASVRLSGPDRSRDGHDQITSSAMEGHKDMSNQVDSEHGKQPDTMSKSGAAQ